MKANAVFCIISIALIMLFLLIGWYVWALVMLAIAVWYGFIKGRWFDDGSYSF